MSDDKNPDAENEVDDQETNEAEGGDKEQGSNGVASPADDDIIIK